MIKNEKEYAVAKAELRRFESALEDFNAVEEISAGVDPVIANAQRGSFARKVNDLMKEVRDYEALVSGDSSSVAVAGIESIGHALIAARLSSGVSQKSLAELAGLKEQQIQRYEKEAYASANIRRLSLIARALNVSLDGNISSDTSEPTNDRVLMGFSVTDFPFSVMKRRKWFDSGVSQKARLTSDEKRAALVRFFAQGPSVAHNALHRKTNAAVSKERLASLLVWQTRVLLRARDVCEKFPRYSPLDASTINGLAKLSAQKNGILEIIDILGKHGIIVLFEPHLPTTKLDGAALSLDGKWAVIALSVRYNRIDNFWFVILHEVGHIVRHWDRVKDSGILDENAGHESLELVEREADEFAENAILPATTWKNSLVRYSKDADQIVKFAERHNIHPALVAGRIRRERSYTEFSELIGEGEVRKVLSQAGHWSDVE